MTNAFNPSQKFVSISITGLKCELMCRYCKGKYLKEMIPATTPRALYETIRYYYRRGFRGFLISGGFTVRGFLNVEPFLPVIKDVKREFRDIVISIHPGLIDKSLIIKLKEAKIDIVDFEFSLSKLYIRYVKNMKKASPMDYCKTYELLEKYGPPYIAPHIVINPFTEEYEYEVAFHELEYLHDHNPHIMVLLIYIPTPNTPSSNDAVPGISYVSRIFEHARRLFKEVSLGCMRPRLGNYRVLVDKIALDYDFDRIVNPHKSLMSRVRSVIGTCCSVPKELLHLFQ